MSNEKTTASPNTSVKPSTFTNWSAFAKAGLVPKEITCDGYFPFHRVDTSCHTRLPFNIQTLIQHQKADHGGGFRFKLRKSEVEWPGWKEFAESGMEVQDVRCDICDEVIPLSAPRLLNHMRPHAGKTRRVREGGEFLITISPDTPLESDDAELL